MSTRLSRLLAVTWPYAVVALIGLVILLPKLGAYGLWDPWEPRYPQAVREMLERDTLVVPWYRGQLRYDKPILAYWGILAGRMFFGLNEFGSRIGGVALCLASLLAVTYGVGRMRGPRAGLLAGAAVAIMPQFYLVARQVTSDVYLVATIGPSLLFFALALCRPERRRLHLIASAVAFGLSILAKGPVISAAILFATLVTYVAIQVDVLWFRRPLRAIWNDVRAALVHTLLFLAVVVLVAVPWHVALVIEQGWGFFFDFVVIHNFARAMVEVYQSGSSEFYFRPFVFGFMPWCFLLPASIACIGRWRGGELVRQFGFEVFLLVSVAVTFAAFSCSITKYTHYVSPALIPFGAVAGITLDRLVQMRREPAARLAWIIAAILFVPVVIDILREQGVGHLINTFTTKERVSRTFEPGTIFTAALVGMWCCMALSALVPSRFLVWPLIACGVVFGYQMNSKVMPELTDEGKSMKGLCTSWYDHRKVDEPIAFHGPIKHGVIFYTSGQIQMIKDRERFLDFMDPAKGTRFAIIETRRFGELNSRFRSEHANQQLQVIDASHWQYELIVNQLDR